MKNCKHKQSSSGSWDRHTSRDHWPYVKVSAHGLITSKPKSSDSVCSKPCCRDTCALGPCAKPALQQGPRHWDQKWPPLRLVQEQQPARPQASKRGQQDIWKTSYKAANLIETGWNMKKRSCRKCTSKYNEIYQNLYMIVTIWTNLQKYVVQKIQYTPMWLFVFITIQQLSRGSFHAVESFSVESFFQNRGGLQSIFHIANLATWLIAPYPTLTKWNLRSSHHSKRCCNSATQQTDFLQRRILADLHYGFCVHHCVLLGAQESMDNKIRNRIFCLQTWEF